MNPRQCPRCRSNVPNTARVCPSCGSALGAAHGKPNADQLGILHLGTRLRSGSYSIGRLLGRGGFGITYLGADNRLGRPVALKEFFPAGAVRRGTTVVPPPTLGSSEYNTAKQRFLQEAQCLARFHHPSIVAVYDVFEENATVYMVMEYLRGENLGHKLERCGKPLPEPEILAIMEPLVDALDGMHAQGVLHRDIKPENIMLADGNGTVRPVLIDFGSARDFVGGATIRHSVVLTPGYAPLEQYTESQRRGPFTDVYALAATLYHLATGVQPPPATDFAAGTALTPPHVLNPVLSVAFDRAIVRGLELKADQRPQSAREFFEELVGIHPTPSTTTKGNGTRRQAPQPAPSVHVERVRQIARVLSTGGTIQRDKLLCSVCRAASMIDPAKAIGKVRCPVCRAAGLEERVPTHARDHCPACRNGKLEAVKTGGLLRCPACRAGSVTRYVKRRTLLFVPDLWAQCDACGANFGYHILQDSLTLMELPGGPGHLDSNLLGQTRPRSEWIRLSGRTEEMYCCADCSAEFDHYNDGRLAWVAVDGQLERVPAEHRGQLRTQMEWVKIGHGVRPEDGTHACPACQAQFDETHPGELTLLRAARDPYDVFRVHRGCSYPVWAWRALAVGMRYWMKPGLICPACTAELQEIAPHAYNLVAYDSARDPYQTGMSYHKQQLPREDWQRLAAGKLPMPEEQQLRAEAQREVWAAILAGEFSDGAAERSYPIAKAGGEQVVLKFPSAQLRQRQGGFYEYDAGEMWITTKKLLYHGSRTNATIPFDKVSDCLVHEAGSLSVGLISLRRWGRARPIYFGPGTETLELSVDGLTLQLPWDANRFVALVENLRRTGP